MVLTSDTMTTTFIMSIYIGLRTFGMYLILHTGRSL